MVTSFEYLVHLILATDNNWPTVVSNLDRAGEVWNRMMIILRR